MKIRVLGSSSAGNCTLVWNDRSVLMLDCGFSPRYLIGCLGSLDLDIPPIAGLLITHAHSDHVNDTAVNLLIENRIPVVVRHELARVLKRMYPSMGRAARLGLLREFDGNGMEIGAFEVGSFEVPHDSPGGCFGFSIVHTSGQLRRKVAFATDLGYPREGLIEEFKDADAIVIESNHDVGMLENSGRPPWLRKRIREIGHLSNDQCAQFVTEVAVASARPPHAVILAHISQQCNTPELAERTTRDALAGGGFSSVRVVQSFRSLPSSIIVC